jgi:prevent-host-death family protein
MQTFTANEAKTRFGEFLDRAQREPVGVLKHDRMVGVMVSVQDFEAMRAFYADRLQHRLDASAQRSGTVAHQDQTISGCTRRSSQDLATCLG